MDNMVSKSEIKEVYDEKGNRLVVPYLNIKKWDFEWMAIPEIEKILAKISVLEKEGDKNDRE